MMELTDQHLIIRRPGRIIVIDQADAERRAAALMGIGHSAPVARAIVAGDLRCGCGRWTWDAASGCWRWSTRRRLGPLDYCSRRYDDERVEDDRP